MPKKKSLAKLIDDTTVLIQKYVRMSRAVDGNCRCVSCGEIFNYKDMDGGHFISRKNLSTKMLEWNINPQCKGCNGFNKNNANIAYAIYMTKEYGPEFVANALFRSRQVIKYTRAEIEEIQEIYKEWIKELS